MSPTPEPKDDARRLEREAASLLERLKAQAGERHRPGVRAEHRRQLEEIISRTRSAISTGSDDQTVANARWTLVQALAMRAEDARHGAGQLSRSAQRAPTRRDCDDGWGTVSAIADTAEAAADEATQVAEFLDRPRARRAAQAAEEAARQARAIVDERNHAYTFHADPGFSFGEGWYLAAAAVLAGVEIQIEPDQAQTRQATRFLLDAGLGPQVVPYRSRPRANKHLTEIVASGFRDDPMRAQRRLRAAFLGEAPISDTIVAWADRALAGAGTEQKVLLWVRYARHHPNRNTSHRELVELTRRARAARLVPVLVGDALRDGDTVADAVDMTLFWKAPLFQGEDMRRAQLQLFEHLGGAHRLVGQVGVTTAGMDGPALMGLPTMYLTEESNVRMREWVDVIPGYQEVVRDEGYLDRVSAVFRRWARPSDETPLST